MPMERRWPALLCREDRGDTNLPPRISCKMTPVSASRTRALSLYRLLMRGAKKMPTPNRKNFVMNKTRSEYRANMHLSNPEEIEFCLRLADTNLDTILTQAEHLTNLLNDPAYRFRDEI